MAIHRIQDALPQYGGLRADALFRGQNVDKPLLPKIARLAQARSLSLDAVVLLERQMLNQFQRQSVPFLRAGIQPKNNLEWLSVAQHYGMPTRLLDWTASMLAALWFAVAPGPEGESDGVLWTLRVPPGSEPPDNSEDLFSWRDTFLFQPFHIDQRIVAQTAWFSVHGAAESFSPLETDPRFAPCLEKRIIPWYFFDDIRSQLRTLGINEAAVFPDLTGLCAEIKERHMGATPAQVEELFRRPSPGSPTPG